MAPGSPSWRLGRACEINSEDAGGGEPVHLLLLKVKRPVAVETEVCYLSSGQGQCRQLQHEPPHKAMPITLTVTSSRGRISVGILLSLLGKNKHSCVHFVLRSDDSLAGPF